MTHFNNSDIPFLQLSDFSNNILIPHPDGKNKKSIILLFGSFCHYCSKAAPVYIKLFQLIKNKFNCYLIQIDGDNTEKPLTNLIKKLDTSYQGVPHYVVFNEQGKFEKSINSGQDTQSLLSALSNN
jgi:thiol-disulfide isomerase/thioredoxin